MKVIRIKDETAVRLKAFADGEDTWDQLVVKLLDLAESPAITALARMARKMKQEEKLVG